MVLRDDQSSPAISGLSDWLQSMRYSRQREHRAERQADKPKMEIKLPKTVKQLLNEEEEESHKQNLHESRCPHPQWNCCTGWPCTSTAPGTSHWTPLSTSPSGHLSHHGDDLMKTKQKNKRANLNLRNRRGKNTPATVLIMSFPDAPGENISIWDNHRISDSKLELAKSSQAAHRNGFFFRTVSGTSYRKGNTSIHMPT